MSCSIHATVEQLTGSWGPVEQWTCINMLSHSNDTLGAFHTPAGLNQIYKRFAALAGVRGDGPKPRGTPGGICPATRHQIARWGVDGHSHSWLPLAEAAQIFLETDPIIVAGTFEGRHPTYHYFNVDEDIVPIEKCRLVFWFDG